MRLSEDNAVLIREVARLNAKTDLTTVLANQVKALDQGRAQTSAVLEALGAALKILERVDSREGPRDKGMTE